MQVNHEGTRPHRRRPRTTTLASADSGPSPVEDAQCNCDGEPPRQHATGNSEEVGKPDAVPAELLCTLATHFCHLLRDFGELVSQGVGVSAELVIRRLDVSASWLSATLLISSLVYW